MYRILIIDDQPLFANGLKSLLMEKNLCRHADFESGVGEFSNVLTGSAYDLALIDVSFCEKELLELLTNTNPYIRILAISENEISINRFFSLVHGIIIRKSSTGKVVKTIRDVLGSKKGICSGSGRKTDLYNLSSREKELLVLICEGHTNPEIAGKLFLGEETVKSYRKNLLTKLNARNTAMLVRIAIERNLI